LRAASYSIGVLRGLDERGALERIDVLSGVSGGSYALSWYVVHLASQTDPFAPAAQQHLLDNSDLFRRVLVGEPKRLPWAWPATAISWLTTGLGTMVNWVEDLTSRIGLGRVTSHYVWAQPTYEHVLGELFHNPTGDVVDPKLEDLAELHNLPMFTIGTTVAKADGSPLSDHTLAVRSFEVTPLRMGSDGLGYLNIATGLPRGMTTLRETVVVSGAAIDSSEQEGIARIGIRLGYLDLGTEIGWRSMMGSVPIGSVYLTDGGFSENLAAYQAVRRLCGHITIVDAEYDPTFDFTSYLKLKCALRREMGVDFSVPDIDRILDPALRLDDDSQSCEEISEGRRTGMFDTSRPVMRGSVGVFPLLDESGVRSDLTLDIEYVKLSIDEGLMCELDPKPSDSSAHAKAVARYGDHVVDYYLRQRREPPKDPRVARCQVPFPQLPTSKLFFDKDRMQAFIDLGYRVAKAALLEPAAPDRNVPAFEAGAAR
jgi:hypothetical protein